MKSTFWGKEYRRGFWFVFYLLIFTVLVIPPFQLLELLVPRQELRGAFIALLLLVATLFMWLVGAEIGAPISASKLPLNTPLLVLWKGEYKDATETTYRRALIQDPEGDQRLFEFLKDIRPLWKTFEEGQTIQIEEKFVQNDYDHDQDRYDLVIRVL